MSISDTRGKPERRHDSHGARFLGEIQDLGVTGSHGLKAGIR